MASHYKLRADRTMSDTCQPLVNDEAEDQLNELHDLSHGKHSISRSTNSKTQFVCK
jgi:hypothetical protein